MDNDTEKKRIRRRGKVGDVKAHTSFLHRMPTAFPSNDDSNTAISNKVIIFAITLWFAIYE